MLHKLKGRFLSTARFYSYDDLSSFVETLVRKHKGVVRLQVFSDDMPYIILLYVSPNEAYTWVLVYDTYKESLVSNVNLDSLKNLLKGPGQVEAYLLEKSEFDVDMEIISFRATLDGSSNYLLMLNTDELSPQVQLKSMGAGAESKESKDTSAEEPKPKPSTISPPESVEDPLYPLLEEMINNELSKIVGDPMFLAKILMQSKDPVVNRVPSNDVKPLVASMIRTSKNKMLTCMFEDGSLCHIYINRSKRVGLCVTDEKGTKVCGHDALKFLRKIEDNMQKISTRSFTTIMMYDLES